jgi:hypothetical protein
VEERGSRFWDAFWIVVPLILGALVGGYFAAQFPTTTADCSQPAQAPSTAPNFALAVVLVGLLIGRIVARSTVGPVAARAFTLAAFGLVVVACGSFFVTTRNEPCPATGLASANEALVWTAPAELHLS